jgi:hypothetical protein
MKFLPETTQTAYSTLLQKLEDSRFSMVSNIGFTEKVVSGKTYWYCQYTDISGTRKQRYIGPDSPETKAIIDGVQSSSKANTDILTDRKRLVAMVAAGGGNMEKGRPAKIIEKLADAGVFDAGGMLIGSYAFSCYGNMLGVVFDEAIRRTEDMDVAYDRSIEIGFVRNVKTDIGEAAPEMVEPKQINPWVPPYEMVAPDGFKIEFLTSKTAPHDKSPVPIERFGVNAQPLEFMDYLIKNPVETAVLYGSGILVNVPDPARFAIHKLAVSQLRPSSKPEKSRKDLLQACALIEYFLEENPGTIILASDDARQRGDMLHSLVEKGIAAMKDQGIARRFLEDCWNISAPVAGLKY